MPTFTIIKGKKKVATSRLEPRRLKQLYEYISRQILSGWYLWSYVHKNNCMSLSSVQQGFRQVSIQYTPSFHQNFKKALHKREVAAPFQTFCYAFLSLFFQNYFLWSICKFSLFFFLMWSIFAWILVETHWHKKLSIMIKTIPLFTCFMSVNLHVASGYKAEYIRHHSPLFTNGIISRLILLYIWQKGDLLP